MSAAAGLAAWVLTAATPAPGSQDVNPTNGGSPGFVGFLFTFVLAILVIGLAFSLVRGMRRMERNGRRLEASDAGAPGAESGTSTGAAIPPVTAGTAADDVTAGSSDG